MLKHITGLILECAPMTFGTDMRLGTRKMNYNNAFIVSADSLKTASPVNTAR